jgi:hypothetical protein
MNQKHRRWLLGFGLLAIVLIGAPYLWVRICGNHRGALYGKVVDSRGQPIPQVNVEIEILYSDRPALPMMFGRKELIRKCTATSDADGDFEFTDITGYSFSIRAFYRDGKKVKYWPPPNPAPKTSFSYDTTSERAAIPDHLARRQDYILPP